MSTPDFGSGGQEDSDWFKKYEDQLEEIFDMATAVAAPAAGPEVEITGPETGTTPEPESTELQMELQEVDMRPSQELEEAVRSLTQMVGQLLTTVQSQQEEIILLKARTEEIDGGVRGLLASAEFV